MKTLDVVIISFIVLIILVIIGFIISNSYQQETISMPLCIKDNCAIRVIDGDTFQIKNNSTIRLLCIDTPEKGEEGYEEAKQFLESLVLDREVILERDVSDRDAYGRLLRYVYINETFVNKEMVHRGYAQIWKYGNDTSKCEEIGG
ncbi:MAG: thermonuclease family protein [Nanoarchaeota archaeon]